MLLWCVSQPVAAQTEGLQRLVAACTAINHAYALARDRADKEAFAELFTDDAVFTILGETFAGKDRIVARLDGDDARNFGRLLITSIHISPTDARTATGVTYFIMFMAPPDATPPITEYTLFMGEYHDRYRMTAEGCKFESRDTKPLFVGERLAD